MKDEELAIFEELKKEIEGYEKERARHEAMYEVVKDECERRWNTSSLKELKKLLSDLKEKYKTLENERTEVWTRLTTMYDWKSV